MDDAEDQHRLIGVDDVVHDAVFTDPQPVKRIPTRLNRLHRLAANPAGAGGVRREFLERSPDLRTAIGWQLLERLCRRRTEFDAEAIQPRSSSLVVRPLA